MTGSIDKYSVKGSSKPRWRYRIYTGQDATGKKQWESHGGFEKQSEAANAMRTRIDELRLERGHSAPITLGEHLRQWLDQHAPQRCTPKTLERYRQLSSYVLNNDSLALTSLRDLKSAQLETALYALLKAKAKRREHLSAKTVRHVAGLMNVALNKAFRLGLIDVNPMLRVELPVVEKHDARSLTAKEIDALLDACLDDWTHPFVQVAMATGCRRGELLALQWTDIDLKTGAVVINKSLEQTREGLRVKRPKSDRSRTFRLPKSAVTALKFQMDNQRDHQRKFGSDYKNQRLVFCEPDGAYLDPALVSQTIVRRMEKAGIKDASLHTLRHSHASGLLSEGVPLPAVSARLGHANTNITASIYAHAMPADDQHAADKWDELMSKKVQ